jgi:HlyD family secretion protein
MKKARWIVIPVVLVGAAAAWLWWGRQPSEAAPRIAFSGNLELREIDIAFKTPGRLAELAVEEGDFVREGDLLARLDDAELRRGREELEAQLEALSARERELRTLALFQERSLEARLDLAKAEVQRTRAALDQLLEGSRRQDIEQARADVAFAEAENERAGNDWRRAGELFAREDISRADHDRYRAAHQGAEASLRRARERLDLVSEGPRSQDIAQARAGLAAAEAGLRQTEAGELEIRRTEESILALRAEADALRARVAQLDERLRDSVALAPMAGVVLVKAAERDEVVAAGARITTVGDLERPWVRGYLQAADLGRVKLGDRVRLTTDSFPGRDYWGRVSFISSEAEFTPKQIETREERVKLVYRIKVDVENPNQELKLNMPVDAEIILDGRRNG